MPVPAVTDRHANHAARRRAAACAGAGPAAASWAVHFVEPLTGPKRIILLRGDTAVAQKKVRLHKGLSHEEVAKVAEQTLASRGVEPPEPGDKMSDGSIYAGISPDTGKPMYAAAADAPQLMTLKQAKAYAAALDAHGHKDWRVPSKAELQALFDNRSAIGGFNETGLLFAGYYWSGSPYTESNQYLAPEYHDSLAWAQSFSDGARAGHIHLDPYSVRCVR